MNEAASLVQSGLSVLIVPLLLAVRALRKKFATDPNKPTINEGVIFGIMFVLGLGLAYAQHSVNPAPALSVTDLWWVQGFLFFAAFVLADLGADATSVKTEKAAAAVEAANPK